METSNAIEGLAALAHPGRLAIFRALVRAGPDGLAAGRLGEQVSMAGSTLSNNLAILSRSGLATARRDGRCIIYAADFGHMTALMAFLLEDCCNGAAAVCEPLAAAMARSACCPTQPKAS